MPAVKHTDLEALARGKTLPAEVFDAIVRDPDEVRRLVALLRFRELFGGEPVEDVSGSTRFTPAAEVGTVDASVGELVPGTGPPRLEGLTFLRVLGEGAFGQVWLAFDAKLNRQCAVKRVAGDGLAEARTLASLPKHLNRPEVYALESYGDGACLVMEYVRGPSLRDLLKQKPIPWTLAAKYMAQAAEGLREVHAKGIRHRDIKPANLVLDEERGEVVVVDFGLASRAGEGGGGTPNYMAPEAKAGRATAKSDVYSLAATMVHLVSGRVPPSPPQPLSPTEGRGGSLPRALADLLDAALEPDEAKRLDLETFLSRVRRVEVEDLADRLAGLARDRGPVKLRVAVSTAPGETPDRYSPPTSIEATRGEGAVTKVRTGDMVRLEATADRGGYFTVLCFGSGGELSVPFSGGQQGKFTQANAVEQWSFRADPPTGTDTFGVVWSMHPWTNAEEAWRRLLNGEAVAMKVTPATRTMTLVEAVTLGEEATWAGAVVAVVQMG